MPNRSINPFHTLLLDWMNKQPKAAHSYKPILIIIKNVIKDGCLNPSIDEKWMDRKACAESGSEQNPAIDGQTDG